MGMFVETATFVGTFFMIASNFFVQKTLRSFMIINLQIENQFKEQTEIFENLNIFLIYHLKKEQNVILCLRHLFLFLNNTIIFQIKVFIQKKI